MTMPTGPATSPSSSPHSLSGLLRPMASSLADGLEAQFKKSFPDGWAAIGATGARPLRNAAEKVLADVAASVLGGPSGRRQIATGGESGAQGGRRSSEADGANPRGRERSLSGGGGSGRKLLEQISALPLTQQAVQKGIAAALASKLGPGLANQISLGAGHAFTGAMRMLSAHEAQKDPASPATGASPDTPAPHGRQSAMPSQDNRQPADSTRHPAADPAVRHNRPCGEGGTAPAEPAELEGSTPAATPPHKHQAGRDETFAPMSPAELACSGRFRRPGRPSPPTRPATTEANAGAARDASTPTGLEGDTPAHGDDAPRAPADAAAASRTAAPQGTTEATRGTGRPHDDGHGHGSDDVYGKHEAAMNRVLERQLRQELDQMRRQVMMDQLKHVGHLFQSAGQISN
jgi:hypothetical protein